MWPFLVGWLSWDALLQRVSQESTFFSCHALHLLYMDAIKTVLVLSSQRMVRNRERETNRQRIEKLHTVLTEDKSDNHLFNSAHIPGIRAPHIIPHPCKRVWEIQSLAEQLTPRNSSALWKGRVNLGGSASHLCYNNVKVFFFFLFCYIISFPILIIQIPPILSHFSSLFPLFLCLFLKLTFLSYFTVSDHCRILCSE